MEMYHKKSSALFHSPMEQRCLSGTKQVAQILSAHTPAIIYMTYKGPVVCKTYDIAGICRLQTKQIQIFIKYNTHVTPPVFFLL